jgi:predicted nucleic acid-binding protein
LVVLDSWAMIAYLEGQAAAETVRSAWVGDGVAMCSINLGEVLYIRKRRDGSARAEADVQAVREAIEVVDADWNLVRAAADLKVRGGLSYADAFCVATAKRLGAPVWTGDPEIVALSDEVDVVDLRAA